MISFFCIRLSLLLMVVFSPAAVYSQLKWTNATKNAEFSKRWTHSSVGFDNKLWVFNGTDENSKDLPDIWNSTDGKTWTCAVKTAPYPMRSRMALVVFNEKLWIIGGSDENEYYSEIWQSKDGINWNRVIESPGTKFKKRQSVKTAVFDNKLWLFGGSGIVNDIEACNFDDVWCSSDGTSWTCVADSTPWSSGNSSRSSFSTTVFQNKIWILGGVESLTYLNDIWNSSDGKTWTKATDHADWSGRNLLHTQVFNNQIWVVGGYNVSTGAINDTWYSSDGVKYTQLAATPEMEKRGNFSSAVFDNKLWLIGGIDLQKDIGYRDIWYVKNTQTWSNPQNNTVYSQNNQLNVIQLPGKCLQINFRLGSPSLVQICLFNSIGQEIAILCNDIRNSGLHTITLNESNYRGTTLTNNLYFVRNKINGQTFSQKVLLN